VIDRAAPQYRARILAIRFGCNRRTTQEGRTIQRGARYEIRVNFCIKESSSPMLSSDVTYLGIIRDVGGVLDAERRLVRWPPLASKKYACFLLLHELGHIILCEERFGGRMVGHGSRGEESQCDEFALGKLASVVPVLGE